jgi:excisionase family DNA binding protein
MWESHTMRDEPRLLVGSEEACRMVGVPRTTFLRWVSEGRITPAHVLPGRTGAKLFNRADVEQLAREKAEAAS